MSGQAVAYQGVCKLLERVFCHVVEKMQGLVPGQKIRAAINMCVKHVHGAIEPARYSS